MKLLFLSSLISCAAAVISLDFNVQKQTNSLYKRDGGLVLMSLLNEQTFYVTNITLGSQKEPMQVFVDTGSSDLWVMSENVICDTLQQKRHLSEESEYSQKRDGGATPAKRDSQASIASSLEAFATDGFGDGSSNDCLEFGFFSPADSTTFKNNNTDFFIAYGDNTTSTGKWGTDTLGFANVSVSDFSFAIVNETSGQQGVLGLGFTGNEASVHTNKVQYENLPIRLRSQGAINKAAYSLYLNEATQESGSILFGAVDHAKYTGDLITVPIVNTDAAFGFDTPIEFTVVVDNIILSVGGENTTITNTPQAALLDSGATLSYLQKDAFDAFGKALGGIYSSDAAAYLVPCISSSNTSKINIDFSGNTVSIPLTDLVLPTDDTNSQCFLAILEQTDTNLISLGDNILRSLYVVYDIDDLELSIAPVKYTNDTDIEIITSTIPGAVKAAQYSSSSVSLSSEKLMSTVLIRSTIGGSSKSEKTTSDKSEKSTATGSSSVSSSTDSGSASSSSVSKKSSGVKIGSGFAFIVSLVAGVLCL